MKNLKSLLLFISLIIYAHSSSQEIKIKSVDESEFPLIKVTIEPSDLKIIDFVSLYILENHDTTAYSIDSLIASKPEKAICFLIDEDLAIETTRNDLMNAIKDITLKMGSGDYVNVILSAEKKTNGNCIFPLSFEFSNNPKSFVEFLDIYFTSANLTKSPKVMDCSIDQTLEFINKKKNIPANRLLFILSKIPYAGGQDWKSLQKKAVDYSISYQWFSFTSKEEFFQTYNSNIQDIINNQLDSINSDYPQLTNSNNKSYILSFYTTQKEKLNQFEIDYYGAKTRSTFERSTYISFFKDNLISLSVIAFFFLLILFFIANLLYTKRQMAISIKELQKSNPLEKKQDPTNKVKNTETIKTQYGSSSVVPSIIIEIGGVASNYELKKLLTTIGRLKENDIVIDDPTISGHHATLTKEGGSFYLQDKESTNGTFVNEIKISKSIIKNGDSIRMGKAMLTITY